MKLLSAENRSAIQEQKDPHSVASVLFKLFYAEILTQDNFDRVLTHSNLKPIINRLSKFNRQNSLTQKMFERLMRSEEKISLANDLTKLRKKPTLFKQSFYPWRANFFSAHNPHDYESQSKTVEYNKQICKH